MNIVIGRAMESGLTWEYERDKSHIPYPYIYGPLHLRQIFLNIYSNCIKYNRPGGKIATIAEALPNTTHWNLSLDAFPIPASV